MTAGAFPSPWPSANAGSRLFAHGRYSLPRRIEDNPQQILRTFEKPLVHGRRNAPIQQREEDHGDGQTAEDRDADALLRLIQAAVRRLSAG